MMMKTDGGVEDGRGRRIKAADVSVNGLGVVGVKLIFTSSQ